jgi:A/G-specific adenine glycosylase
MTPLAARLLKWYAQHRRALPWRGRRSAYAVWVSEIMLQQTRVEAVIPYYKNWMRRFPTLRALASASERQVLRAWEGLGYYSRARHLLRAARTVVAEFGGRLPRDPAALIALPGIGRYTAAAIASIAFGLDEAAVDGNIKRVYARLFDVTEPADSPVGEQRLWALAAAHLPSGRAGDYNQALMDLGASICVPKNPRCDACPLTRHCLARRAGTQELRPVRQPVRAVPHRVQAAAVRRVLLARRPDEGLLGGLWGFPNSGVRSRPARAVGRAIKAAYGLRVRTVGKLCVVRHAYTHFKVTLHAFRCELAEAPRPGALRWVRLTELSRFPMGKIDRRIAKALTEYCDRREAARR